MEEARGAVGSSKLKKGHALVHARHKVALTPCHWRSETITNPTYSAGGTSGKSFIGTVVRATVTEEGQAGHREVKAKERNVAKER